MGKTWPKLIRDPVHDVIPFGNNACDKLLLELINTPEFMRRCAASSDAALAGLARGLLERRLFKCVDATDAESVDVGRFRSHAVDILRRKGPSFAAWLVDDSPADTPYKPYDPDAGQPATQIYIEDALGKVKEFGELSAGAKALKAEYSLLRYYFPAEFRDAMEVVAKDCLLKGKGHA